MFCDDYTSQSLFWGSTNLTEHALKDYVFRLDGYKTKLEINYYDN